MIPGVILASGKSRRFGRPKALMPAGSGGPSFVARLVTSFHSAGVADVIVVGRPDDAALAREVDATGAALVENPDADRGQLSSLVAAIDALQPRDAEGIIVMPVDMPLVESATIAAVRDAFRRAGAPIARATHGGRHGHPVVFGAALFEELRRADPEVGARAVVRAHAAEVINVEVNDPAVLRDVDTPQDYLDLFGTES